MRRLAAELDVTTNTVYWHVGSRDALITEIIRTSATRLADRAITGTTPRERVTAAARHIWDSALENRAITSLAHQTGTTPLLEHHLELALVHEIEAAGLRATPPPSLCARFSPPSVASSWAPCGANRRRRQNSDRRTLEHHERRYLRRDDRGPVLPTDHEAVFTTTLGRGCRRPHPRLTFSSPSPQHGSIHTMTESTAPQARRGEIAGWPKLVITYPTEPGRIANLLPPGLEPTVDDTVQIGIYCVPINDEPEYGVSIKVPAAWRGVEGQYNLGMGIDQEAAVHISAERNGQPKFLCDIDYFRFGTLVGARATHQGYTFVEFEGQITGESSPSTPSTSGGRNTPERSVAARDSTSARSSSTWPPPWSRSMSRPSRANSR